jgi:hypothetical protein
MFRRFSHIQSRFPSKCPMISATSKASSTLAHSKLLRLPPSKCPTISDTSIFFKPSNTYSEIVEVRLLQSMLRSSHLPQTSFRLSHQISCWVPKQRHTNSSIQPWILFFRFQTVQSSMFCLSWTLQSVETGGPEDGTNSHCRLNDGCQLFSADRLMS